MTDPAALSSALIGEIFVERGHITHDQLEEALVAQAETGELLGEILVSRFGVPRVELAGVLAEQWAMMERAEVPPSSSSPPASETPVGNGTRDAPPALAEVDTERRPIGEIFVEHGVVTQSQLDAAVLAQGESGQRLGEVLVAQGAITRLELASALAEQWSTLQKIRPPEPKAAEPWQEAAVRAAASDAGPEPVPLAAPPADVEHLRDAVKALEERLRTVSATASPSPPDEKLRETTAALTARIDELEGRLDAAASPELAELRMSIDEIRASLDEFRARLDAPDTTVVELEQRLETTVDGLLERIETLHQAPADEAALGGLRDSVEGLKQQTGDFVARDEVDAIRVALGAVSEQVKDIAGRTGGVTHDDLDRQIGLAVGELREQVDAATTRHDAEALTELRATVLGLEARLGELQDVGANAAAGGAVDEVRARLDELAEQIDRVQQESAARLADVIDAEQGERVALAGSVQATIGRLGDLDELRARVDALALPSDVVHDALKPIEMRLSSLADQVDEVREVAFAPPPPAPSAETVEQLTTSLADLSARLREVASRPAGVSQDQLERRLADVTAALESQSSLSSVSPELAGELGSIRQAVADLELRLSDVAGRDAVAGIDATVAELGRRVDDLGEALGEAAKRLEQGDGPTKDQVDALIAAERAARDELTGRVNAIAMVPLTDEHARAELAELRLRVSELAESGDRDAALDELRHRMAELGELSQRFGEMDELRQKVAELAELPDQIADADELRRLASELAGLPGRLSEVDELRQRVAELAERPDQSDVLAELRQQVSELAARPDQHAALAELRHRVSELAARPDQEGALDELRRSVAELAERPSLVGDVADLHRRLSELAERPSQEGAIAELRDRVAELADRADSGEAVAALERSLAERDELEAAARGSLEAKVADVQRGLQELGELQGRVDALASEQHDTVRHRDLEDLRHRLAEVGGRLDGLASAEWVTTLEQAAAETSHATSERLEGLEARLAAADHTAELAQLHTLVGDLGTRLGGVDAGLAELAAEVDRAVAKALRKGLEHTVAPEALAQLATDLGARLADLEAAGAPTRAALDELGMRLGATEQQAWALPEQLDDRFGGLHQELLGRIDGIAAAYDPVVAALHARLDELAGTQGAELERLASIEHAAASANVRLEGLEARHAHDGTVSDQIAVLTARLDAELALAEERGTAVERAIRKGLAGLGERLTANEASYLESGAALRRSIERLGAAVVEADTRMSDMPLDPPAFGYVAFVPTADGYRLRPLDGAVPAVGELIEVEGASGSLRVARVARSPLPLDRRACAYLEHV